MDWELKYKKSNEENLIQADSSNTHFKSLLKKGFIFDYFHLFMVLHKTFAEYDISENSLKFLGLDVAKVLDSDIREIKFKFNEESGHFDLLTGEFNRFLDVPEERLDFILNKDTSLHFIDTDIRLLIDGKPTNNNINYIDDLCYYQEGYTDLYANQNGGISTPVDFMNCSIVHIGFKNFEFVGGLLVSAEYTYNFKYNVLKLDLEFEALKNFNGQFKLDSKLRQFDSDINLKAGEKTSLNIAICRIALGSGSKDA